MPKMKTHSGAKKRFKVTGSGKIKRFRAKHSHLLRKKSKKQKKVLASSTIMEHTGDANRIKALLCLR